MNKPLPNKDLGQHWLRDKDSLQAVLAIADISPNDTVIEVGPGLGTLTQLLVEQAQRVVAVEFDQQLAAQLPARVPSEQLEVVNQDIRSFNFASQSDSYKVVGNIPYYLTSHLLRQLLETDNPPQSIGLLVQKEVAERITAEPGQLSVLGVTSQLLAEVTVGPVVPAELFEPPPKVDSQVVGLAPCKLHGDEQQIIRIVKLGFAQRRKQLKNTLAAGLRADKDELEAALKQCGLNPQVRPQALSIVQWRKLTDALISNGLAAA